MSHPRPEATGDGQFEFEPETEEEEEDNFLDEDDDGPASISSDDSGYERWLAIQRLPVDTDNDHDTSKGGDREQNNRKDPQDKDKRIEMARLNAQLAEDKVLLEEALLKAEESVLEKTFEIELLQEENDLLVKQIAEKESKEKNASQVTREREIDKERSFQELQQRQEVATAQFEKTRLEVETLTEMLREVEIKSESVSDSARQEKDLLTEEIRQKAEEVTSLTNALQEFKQNSVSQIEDHNSIMESLKGELAAEKSSMVERFREKDQELNSLSEKFKVEKAELEATHRQQQSQVRTEQFETDALLEVKNEEIETLLEKQASMDRKIRRCDSQKAKTEVELMDSHRAREEAENSFRELYGGFIQLFEMIGAKPSNDDRVAAKFPNEAESTSPSALNESNWHWPDSIGSPGKLGVSEMLEMTAERIVHLLEREKLADVWEQELLNAQNQKSQSGVEIQQLQACLDSLNEDFQRSKVEAEMAQESLFNQNMQAESELQGFQNMISELLSEAENEKERLRSEKESIAERLKQFESQYVRLTNERADLSKESDKRMGKLRKENQMLQEEVRRAKLQQNEQTDKHERARQESDRVNRKLHSELDKKDAEIQTLKQQKPSQPSYTPAYTPAYNSATTTTSRYGKGICQICFKPECPLGSMYAY